MRNLTEFLCIVIVKLLGVLQYTTIFMAGMWHVSLLGMT